MKRFIPIILSVLLLMSGIAFSEEAFDVSAYSEEELIDIMRAIADADTQLGYVYSSDAMLVGTDIPAGTYEVWVQEDDIGTTEEMLEYGYQCGDSRLCWIGWGDTDHYLDDSIPIYYDEYGVHKQITLKEGTYFLTEASKGIDYIGFRIKYFPNRKSGLFAND